jgi:hypothetical protein
MSLSRQSVSALMDLIENKLSCMTVSDRDDLRQKVTLQRAMCELSSLAGMSREAEEPSFGFVPRRGRRRRFVGEGTYA